ncbi:MAG: HipA N-terminal domain-containing protein [Acidimicrobiales bacterium]
MTVLLEGKPIGHVERLASGALRLRYDEGYRVDPTATPLSVSMPSTEEIHGDARLTPWLWGLLPDNADGVLARWERLRCVSGVAFPRLRHPRGSRLCRCRAVLCAR